MDKIHAGSVIFPIGTVFWKDGHTEDVLIYQKISDRKMYFSSKEHRYIYCRRFIEDAIEGIGILGTYLYKPYVDEFFDFDTGKVVLIDHVEIRGVKDKEEPAMEEKEPKNDIYNSEHYADPTAYHALKNVDKRRDGWLKPEEYREVKERRHKLLGCIFRVCELSGFTVENRIELRDKKTGKVWK